MLQAPGEPSVLTLYRLSVNVNFYTIQDIHALVAVVSLDITLNDKAAQYSAVQKSSGLAQV